LTGFGAQTGLVSAILEAGASAVIANSLGADGETGYGVVTDFYRRLESSGNIAAALRDAKLQALKNNPDTGLYDWAGYQLFIN
jgi:CHAT domain-containing protein